MTEPAGKCPSVCMVLHQTRRGEFYRVFTPCQLEQKHKGDHRGDGLRWQGMMGYAKVLDVPAYWSSGSARP